MNDKKSPKAWKIINYSDIEQANPNSDIKNNNKNKDKKHKRPLIWGDDLSDIPYIKRNLIPVILETVFLLLCFRLPYDYIIFANLFFYISIFIYFNIIKVFSFSRLWRNITSGIQFWKSTLICTLLFAAAFCITSIINHLFPELNTGFLHLKVTDKFTFFIYSIISVFLAPLAEETFFRGSLIYTKEKSLMIITSVISILLFAITHSFTLWGIITVFIWAVPLTLVFLKTRNFYVTMTAHFIVNIIGFIASFLSLIKTIN